MHKSSSFSTSLPLLVISYPNRCRVLYYLWFWLAFPFWIMMCIFSCASWPYVYLLWRNVHSALPPIFYIRLLVIFWLCCWSSSYILDVTVLSDTWLANTFSHFVGCLFTLLIVSFDAHEFYFDGVQFIYVLFCCFWINSRINCQILCREYFPMFFLLRVF